MSTHQDGPVVAYAVGIVCAMCAGDDLIDDDDSVANALRPRDMDHCAVCQECGALWDALAGEWIKGPDDWPWSDDDA